MGLKQKPVVDAHIALSALIQCDRANKYVLGSDVRIRLAGSLRKTKPVYEDYNAEKVRLFQKFGKPNKDGELEVGPSNPHYAEFHTELAKMNQEDTEIEGFSSVTKEELFGKIVKTKDGETPENQIDVDILTTLLEVGILEEPK